MSRPDKYQDFANCPFCNRETRQEFYDSGHERDGSNDWQKCLECGAMKYGFSDEWTEADSVED